MLTDNATGERFCGKCGYVISERINESGPEWRSFTQDEHSNRARTGVPTSLTMHDMGLATIIGHENRDSTGKPLSASMKNIVKRLRIWDSRSQAHETTDRNLRQALSELNRLQDKLALSDAIIEKTAYLYRKAIDKRLIRGRSVLGILAATLYIACRNSETPRTLNDVSSEINIKKKDISRCYRVLLRELELKMPLVDPIKCISRIASKAGLSEKVERRAHTILKNASECVRVCV